MPQGWNLPRAGDGALQALELGLSRHARYKLAVGAWRLTRGTAREQAHRGVYALADVTLLNLGQRHLGGFAQWGQTPPLQSPIGRYVGAGLRWRTAHHGRISAGIARTVLSPAFRAQQAAAPRAETAYELTWRLRVAPRLTLQPDLQYIA
ncbi:carbohydrate-selective porin OprB precursor, partial [mine drainage metagenome]